MFLIILALLVGVSFPTQAKEETSNRSSKTKTSKPSNKGDQIHSDIFRMNLRLGTIRFTGHRSLNKQHHEILNKSETPTGNVVWPRFTVFFNPHTLLKPVFGVGAGLIYYNGESTRSYQSSTLRASTSGLIMEGGFIIGFRPNLAWLLLFSEIGNGFVLSEQNKISSAAGSKSYEYQDRFISTQISLGVNAAILNGFFAEFIFTGSLFESDDEMILIGGGYAF